MVIKGGGTAYIINDSDLQVNEYVIEVASITIKNCTIVMLDAKPARFVIWMFLI